MRDLRNINADNESDGVPALDTHNLTGRVTSTPITDWLAGPLATIDDDIPFDYDYEPIDGFGYIGDECG